MRKLALLACLTLAALPFLALPALAQGQGDAGDYADLWSNKKLAALWILAPVGAAVALVFAWLFFKQMKQASPGNDTMQKIAKAVSDGAMAYLKQQYKVVGIVFLVLLGVLSLMAYGLGIQHGLVPWAFLTGGFFSGLCGFLGMKTATLASSRTAQAASENLNKGLQIAFRSGAVMGLVVVGFALLDIAAWFVVCNDILHMPLHEVVVTMLAFGMGASTQALFARVGGGIYTKAADVGSDLVGKVEAGIPEDDPRNPATIADNVGDNVGDVAGMGADLYESYAGSILATAALGFATAQSMAAAGGTETAKIIESLGGAATASLPWVIYPMVVAGLGIILSIIGIYAVRTGEDTSLKSLMGALFKGINMATVLTAVAALFIGIALLNDSPLLPQGEGTETMGVNNYIWGVWIAIVVGLIAGVIVAKAAEYYTSNDYKPVKGLAENALTGHATVIIDGIAVGMLSVGIPIITIVVGIFLAFTFSGGFADPILGLYGISIAAVGMLSTLGITLATDAYGPIADNAGGNATMAGLPEVVRQRTDALDACGNTTAATGKGFAIASAALTAMALLAAYVEEVRIGIDRVVGGVYADSLDVQERIVDNRTNGDIATAGFKNVGNGLLGKEIPAKEGKIRVEAYLVMGTEKDADKKVVKWSVVRAREAKIADFMAFYNVTLMNPNVLVGIFIGAMMVFVFAALTMKAVGRAAQAMVVEVRRQFKEMPGILEGTQDPDYASCVMISTKGAQREMIVPSLAAITVPIVVGLIFDVSGVMGLLVGTLSSGFAVAIMMAAAGGAWDNAKKLIEAGGLKDAKGEVQGKGSLAHKAAVTGDTVGDPFKDTSGPSLNILIKLMTMVSIVFVGLTLKFSPAISSLWKG